MLNEVEEKNRIVKRIKFSQESIRVYLTFSGFMRWIDKLDFEIISYNQDLDQTLILKGVLPTNNQDFELKNLAIDANAGLAQFIGNKSGGEVVFSPNLLEPCSRFLIRLSTGTGQLDESEWMELSCKLQDNTKEIFNQTIAIIPCYNAEKFIHVVAEETIQEAKKLIIINDGSTDSSLKEIEKVQKKYPQNVVVVSLEKNQGKGFALLTGFKEALKQEFKTLVCLDADGQHHPTDIPYLAKEIIDGYDLAIGSRLFKLMPFRSRFSNTIISFFLNLFYSHSPEDTQSGMRAFNPPFIEEIISKIKGGCYELEFEVLLMALKENKKIRSIPISTVYIDKNKSSHFKPLKDSYKIIKVFFSHVIKSIFRRG